MKFNKNKGITLIALVVTIVVLLILAAVTLSLALNNNGIISRTKQATELNEMARIKEEAEMVKMDAQISLFEKDRKEDNDYLQYNKAIIKDNTKIRRDALAMLINKHFEGSTVNANRITTADEKYDIIVRNNLDIAVVKHGENYLKAGDMEIVYYVPEGNSEQKEIEIYIDIGRNPDNLTYSEFVKEYLKDKNIRDVFVEINNYDGTFEELVAEGEEGRTVEELEAEIQAEYGMTLDEFLTLQITSMNTNAESPMFREYLKYLADAEGKDREELEEMFTREYQSIFNSWPGYEDVVFEDMDDALQHGMFGYGTREKLYEAVQNNLNMTPEEFLKMEIGQFRYEKINGSIYLECPDGSRKEINANEMYTTYTVNENGDYEFLARKSSGERATAVIGVTGISGKFSKIYTETKEYIDADGKKAVIPKGFAVGTSEYTSKIKTGLVITDKVDEQGHSTGNEFVWIPVDNPNDIYGTDENGNYLGKLYDFENNGENLGWKEENGIMELVPIGENEIIECEPEVITKVTVYGGSYGTNGTVEDHYDALSENLNKAGFNTNDMSNDLNNDGVVDAQDFKIQLQNEFTEVIESIKENGGFYVGRYETRGISENEAYVNRKSLGSRVQDNWYDVYRCSKNISSSSEVKTALIWGCQWDAMMKWMQNSDDSKVANFPTWKDNDDEEEKKYYNNNCINNMYQLTGDTMDCTMEAKICGVEQQWRIGRGEWDYSGPGVRIGDTYFWHAGRAMLYIK